MSEETAILITTARIGDVLPTEFLGLDVTQKSGIKTLAPPWWIIRDYKSGKMPWAEYAGIYHQLMRRSQAEHFDVWDSLVEAGAAGKVLCLQCYCRRGAHCHRHLLAQMIKEYAMAAGYEARIIEE